MGSRLFLRSYVLEGENGGVMRRGEWVSVPQNMVVIGLLVMTMEVILRKSFLQGDQGDWNNTWNGRGKTASLRPRAQTWRRTGALAIGPARGGGLIKNRLV